MAFIGYSLSALATQVRANMASITAAIARISSLESGKVNKTQKVNGHALTGDVTVTKADVSLGNVPNYTITGSVGDSSDSKFSTAGAVKKAYDLANSKITKVQADGYYLGKTATATQANELDGHYIYGGQEEPNYFGGGKVRCQLINSTNGGGISGWTDALWISSYSGSDEKISNVLLFSKGGAARAGFRQQDFDSTTWGTFNEFYHTGKKPTPSELGAVAKAVLDGMFPVGHILLTTTSNNPSTYGYVGTWALLEGDASIHTTTGSGVGTYAGSNTPTVPVPLHSHSAKITPSGEHTHQQTVSRANDLNWGAGDHVTVGSDDSSATSNSTNRTREAGHHTHPVSIENAGTSGATLDVRGRRFMVYAWRRTK